MRDDSAPDDYEDDDRRIIVREKIIESQPRSGWEKRVVEVLLVATVLASATLMFSLKDAIAIQGQSLAVLQTTQQFQQRMIEENKNAIFRVEGRVFRGIDGYEDAKQQPK